MNLVKDDCVDKFICEVGAAYQEKIGYTADFYVVDVGDDPCYDNEKRGTESKLSDQFVSQLYEGF